MYKDVYRSVVYIAKFWRQLKFLQIGSCLSKLLLSLPLFSKGSFIQLDFFQQHLTCPI